LLHSNHHITSGVATGHHWGLPSPRFVIFSSSGKFLATILYVMWHLVAPIFVITLLFWIFRVVVVKIDRRHSAMVQRQRISPRLVSCWRSKHTRTDRQTTRDAQVAMQYSCVSSFSSRKRRLTA